MSTSTKLEHHLVHERCENAEQLKAWIDCYTGLNIPTQPVCPHHRAPFDYIHHTYFEPAKDLIVWAPRGGGKTRLAALATLLDLLHKPGCAVRILGGSLEQSLRMWEHLFPDLTRIAEDLLDTKAKTSRRLSLSNGSSVAVLTQSQRAVRGLRVQKLRCDEVEMFKPEVWEAAQLVTKSRGKDRVSGIGCRVSGEENADLNSDSYSESALHPTPEPRYPTPDLFISGAIEAISTFHQPWGLMSRIIDAVPARGIRSLSMVHPRCAGTLFTRARVRDLSAVGGMPGSRENQMQRIRQHRRRHRDEAARVETDVGMRDALFASERQWERFSIVSTGDSRSRRG